MSGVDVMISDIDFPEVREVDLKLIELGRTLQGKIVTNDFNLNKVAQLRGVEVLNINELANALKPVVLPGEFMKVFILKEGKEYNQGVAYLDDGTMVVVDNARRMISRNIDVVVTSVLQTTAGKMIFGRYIEGAAPARASGSGARRPRPAQARAGKVTCRSRPFPCENPAVSLVADGLLSDSRRQRSTRSCSARRRCVSTLFDRERRLRPSCARAWAWLILKTTGVRVRVERARAPRSVAQLRRSPPTIRASTTSRSCSRRCRCSCGSSRRIRSGGFRFSAGTCSAPGTCWSIGRIRAPAS